MTPYFATLLDGLRTTLLRRPRNDAYAGGPGLFVAIIVTYLVVVAAIAAVDVGGPVDFAPSGVLTVLTDSMLTLVAAWLLVSLAKRGDIVWGAASVLLASTVITALVIHWPLDHLMLSLIDGDHDVLVGMLELFSRTWWLLVLIAFAYWLEPRGLARVLGAAVLAYAVSAAVWWWLPASPVVVAAADTSALEAAANDASDAADADDDETPDKAGANAAADADADPAFDAESVMYAQPDLLAAALAKVKPQTPGKVDLYVVAFGGDGEQNVFRNETEYVEQLFSQRFDAEGHIVVLENNPATVETRPLASLTNLTRALDGIATKMDPAEDILLVYLSSHGSSDHQLLVDLDPLPLDQIEPEDLADALKTTPSLRWKVMIVNACYSGGFVDALRDDSTMVIASARADRTSFGCGADSDITYFAKAYLVEALNKTTSLRDAFDLATKSVTEWETADKQTHSEPQIASSSSIEAKLANWSRHLPERPAVPFHPADVAVTP